jgi:hypothetical protein
MPTITIPVQASADDAWASLPAYTLNLTGDAIVWGKHSTQNYPMRAYIRFPVNLPKGVIIQEAYLRLTSRYGAPTEPDNADFTANLCLIDLDNCPDFSAWRLIENLWNAPRAACVSWHQGPQTINQPITETPNIASLIQAFINRAGYAPGNYIGLMLDEGDAGDYESHGAISFDSTAPAERKPTLEITYTTGITYTLTITATLGGKTDPPAGTYTYDEGSTVVITAIPDPGYYFDHWEINGTIETANPISVLMNTNITALAAFTAKPRHSLTVNSTPIKGVGVTVDGAFTGPTPITLSVEEGTHTISVPASVEA